MDQYNGVIGNIAETDLLFSEKLATIGLHKTNKLMETLEKCVVSYKRSKNTSIIKNFLKDLETVDDDSFKENEQNKPNKESIRPSRKAQSKLKSITEQENKAALLKNVKVEPGTLEADPVYYDASLMIKTESKEMPPPDLPARKGKLKKEKASMTEAKERKPSTRGRKKRVESPSRDSDVIYQPNEIVKIDIDTDEDINKNTFISDADSVDGDDQSVRLTKQLQPKAIKDASSKLKKTSNKSTNSETEEDSRLQNVFINGGNESDGKENSPPSRGTTAINKQVDIEKRATSNILHDLETENTNDQITSKIKVKSSRMKPATEQQEGRTRSTRIVKNVSKSAEKDSVIHVESPDSASECKEMPPPAIPAHRVRPKREKISVTEVKERKQSARGKKKKVENISKDEMVHIDNDTDEDVNRNIIVSDAESVDDISTSHHLTKLLQSQKNVFSNLEKTNVTHSKDRSGSDSEREKFVKPNKEECVINESETEELSQPQTTSLKKQEKCNSPAPTVTIGTNINKPNILDGEEVKCQIINDQIYNDKKLVEAENTTMKVKPPRTKKTRAHATKELVSTQTTVTNNTAETNAADSTIAVTNIIESNSTFTVTNKQRDTFLVSNQNTEVATANITYAATTNVEEENINPEVKGTFVLRNNQENNSPQVNGTFILGNNQEKNSPLVNGTFIVDSNKIPVQNLNETQVLHKLNEIPTPQTDSTFVVGKENSPARKESACSVYEDALEHIQNEVKVAKGVVKKLINKGPKPVFNPFENSPVKKKVEAFEKLGAEIAVESQTRVTRTKTRNKAKAQQQEAEKKSQIPIMDTVSRVCTPSTSSRYLPSNAIYFSCKTTKTSTHTTPISSTRTMSALKASQQEFREREQRRKEKEEEAMRKKEQLLKAQMEEKKRKREERELKAKQQRDAQEKEKRKMLELQAQKEEKLRRQQAEKQEKLIKLREEAEKKRLLVKQRNNELKRLEEQSKTDEEKRKMEELRWIKQEEERMRKLEEMRLRGNDCQMVVPIYMIKKAPLLPTYDCYDSDDEEGQKKTASTRKPDFIRSEQLKETLRCVEYVDSKLKNTLFCLKPQTPNLREIFEIIDPKKLRRNSSAVWKHAPRFTLMPTLRGDEDE